MDAQKQKSPFYKTIWFWLIIIGVVILLIGALLFFTKWISNNLLTLGVMALGLIVLIIGIILLFVGRNKQKKQEEMMTYSGLNSGLENPYSGLNSGYNQAPQMPVSNGMPYTGM